MNEDTIEDILKKMDNDFDAICITFKKFSDSLVKIAKEGNNK